MASPHADPSSTASVQLLAEAQRGNDAALNRLLERYWPRLSRWASGRLPRWARDVADTDDLVQDTLIRTMRNVSDFDDRGDGALQAYLRQAILNRIRDEVRKRGRRPTAEPIDEHEQLAAAAQSPLEATIGAEALARYDRALQQLDAGDRQAIIARIELGCSYKEIADALGKPSADAARMAVSRALVTLARLMHDGR